VRLLGYNALPDMPEITIELPVKLTRAGLAMRLVQPSGRGAASKEAGRSMIELLVKARQWWKRLGAGDLSIADISREENINSSWVSRVARLNFLAPELVTAILAGEQPAALNAMALTSSGPIPLKWTDQVAHFAPA